MIEENVDSKRLAKNTIALYVRTFIVMIVSLYIARIMLNALGTENYGIYNVVGTIVVTFSFFNFTLQTAIQRFLTICVGKNNEAELQKVFSISIFILAILTAIILLLSDTVGLWFLENKLQISPERMFAAKIALQFSIITFSLGVMRIPFTAMIIAWENMSFFAYISILEQAIRLAGVLLIARLNHDTLIMYSALVAIIAVITFCADVVYCKKNYSGTRIIFIWDKKIAKELFSFSGWTFLSSTANMGTNQAFAFLLNIFYGVVANAAMGIANQVSNAVNSFVASFQTAFKPQLVKSCAQEDWRMVHQLVHTTSKVSFLLMFIPGVIIIINIPYILGIWLIEVPAYTVSFCRLLLVQLIIDATTGPYYATIMAKGTIKWYQIAVSCAFVLDIVGIIVLFKLGVDAEYILYSRIVTRGGLCMIIGLYFMNNLIGFNVSSYLRQTVVPIIVYIVLVVVPCLLIMSYYYGTKLLAFSISTVLLLGIPLAYYLVLNVKERSLVADLLISKIRKIKN